MNEMVGIIIPCFNMAKYLPETLLSIKFQTYSDFEVIVVNDGSTDGSEAVAKQFAEGDERIRLVCHDRNRGLPAARNTGIAASRAEYILPLDADDLLEPTAVEAMLAEALRRPSKIIYSDVFLIPDVGVEGRRSILECPDYDFQELLKRVIMFPTSMFPKQAWRESGGFKHIGEGFEDWEFWIALGELGYEGYRIPRPLYSYRVKAEGSMRLEAVRAREKLVDRIKELHPVAYGTEVVDLGCCDKVKKPRGYNQVEPSGVTVEVAYSGGAGPHTITGPMTGAKYKLHPKRPTTMYVEDAEVILRMTSFEEA